MTHICDPPLYSTPLDRVCTLLVSVASGRGIHGISAVWLVASSPIFFTF